MKPDTRLGPWTLGIDNVSAVTALMRDEKGREIALRDAVNVDIDRDGRVTRRGGAALALAMLGAHSLRATSQGALFAADARLYRYGGGAALELAALNSDDACDYAELDDGVIVANRSSLLRVRAGTARALGLPVPPAVLAEDVPAGGLSAGRYAVAVAFQRDDGEEGPLSAHTLVTVGEGCGIQIDGLPMSPEASTLRVYRTTCNGDALYHCCDVPVGTMNWLLGNDTLGKLAPFPFMARMPPGRFVTTWRGRLLTARGRTIMMSEPLTYGVSSLRHNFVQAPHRVTLLHGTNDGVYVGTAHGVWFMRGTGPRDAEWRSTGAPAPLEGAYGTVPGDAFNAGLGLAGQTVLVWLSARGFVLATQDGTIIAPQASRVRVGAASAGALVYAERRLTAAVD